MRILLIDLDKSTKGIPNLALTKISAYHKQKGDLVGFKVDNPDKIYASVIFTWNRDRASGPRTWYPGVPITIGGPGWNFSERLPDEIERIKPDYDLYPSTFSQGFSTRGCIRNCGFCIVPKKEGQIRAVQHPEQFHDDRFSECMLMDNNILAVPDHARIVLQWFIDQGIQLEMTQGYDFRLLTEEFAGLIKDAKHRRGHIRFAWDDTKDESKVMQSIKLLKFAGIDTRRDVMFYVLAGYKTGIEDALYRCNRLREADVQAFVMPYRDDRYQVKDRRIIKLAKWANRPFNFWKAPFKARGIA